MAYSIPEDIVRRVKNAANIVELVSEYVVLKKAGRNYLGLCPFHAEKTPSFTVSEEKQIFYCFGCHTGGNIFSFLMQQGGLTFPDAVRTVAARYSIDVPDNRRLTPAQQRRLSERERLFKVNEAAMIFFQEMLRSPQAGRKAMTYLLERGMTKNIIDGFHMGYAPDAWDGLLHYGRKNELATGDLLKTGLIIERKDKSGYYDRFRSRVMFPILDSSQQVVGFGGRVLTDDLPKYLNSPETPIYHKGESLYGMHRARQAARVSSLVYVVEGYFDAIAMHLYGFENTVASLGTALTAEQVQLLKGMVGPSGKAILVYDADDAGLKAAQRSIPIFEQGKLDARILTLPKGYDPDQFLREFGPEAFHKAGEKASAMMVFLMESMIEKFGFSLEGKVRTVSALQNSLAAIQDNVARMLYIKQLAERLNIDESAILEKILEIVPQSVQNVRQPAAFNKLAATVDDKRRLERQMIAMLLHYPDIISDFIGRNLLENFEDQALKKIAEMLVVSNVEGPVPVSDLLLRIEDPQHRNMVAKLTVSDEHWDRSGCERLMTQFEARYQRKTKDDLQRRIIDAEKNNDIDLLSKLLRQKQKQAAKALIN